MRLAPALEALHAGAVRSSWLKLAAATTRGLLALGFIPPGLTKVLGHRFTALPATDPVGAFFDAFFQARGYYVFVGAAQVLAGALLLFPQTAAIGAALYFPIILNIFVITVAVGFQGTPIITGLMLLACTFLLAWDYDRWKGLLPGLGPGREPEPGRHLGLGMTLLSGGTAALGALGPALLVRAWLLHASIFVPAGLLLLAVVLAVSLLAAFRRQSLSSRGRRP